MGKGKGKGKKKSTNKTKKNQNNIPHDNEAPKIKKNKQNKIKQKHLYTTNKKTFHNDAEFRRQLEGWANGNNNFRGTRQINNMAEDGNCLFRSLSDQLHGDYGKNHLLIRSEVCDYLLENEESFKIFVVLDEDEGCSDEYASSYSEYVDRMKQESEWGGNPELVAAARLYRRNITIYSAEGNFSIDSGCKNKNKQDILLSYHDNSHYNSVHIITNEESKNTSNNEIIEENNKQKVSTDNNVDDDIHIISKSKTTDKTKKHKKKMKKKNEPCECGSGLIYKNCCLKSDKSAIRADRRRARIGIIDSSSENENIYNAEKKSKESPNRDSDRSAIDLNFNILQI